MSEREGEREGGILLELKPAYFGDDAHRDDERKTSHKIYILFAKNFTTGLWTTFDSISQCVSTKHLSNMP